MFLIFPSLKARDEKMGSLRMPKELENAQIVDKPGALIPVDISLVNGEGKSVNLGHYFSPNFNGPVILTLGYFECPMLCSLLLNGLTEVVNKIHYIAGKDFRIISVSIDPKENFSLAQKKQENYVKNLNLKEKDPWIFHVTSQENARKLADAVGFNYYFDKKNNQYAHGAGFFVLSPKGVLARTLYGISFSPTDLKLSIQDASQGKVGSLFEKVILSCFHYDPDSHRYGIYILGIMRIFGVITILIMLMVLIFYFRAEKQKSHNSLG